MKKLMALQITKTNLEKKILATQPGLGSREDSKKNKAVEIMEYHLIPYYIINAI